MNDFEKALLDGEVSMYLLKHAPEYIETVLCHEGPRSYSKYRLSAKKRVRLYLAARSVVLAEQQFKLAQGCEE